MDNGPAAKKKFAQQIQAGLNWNNINFAISSKLY